MSRRPRVLVIIGTRPEGIKLAPVVQGLAAHDDAVDVRVALTGQHSELLDQVIDMFEIPVAWDLEIMRENQSLNDVARLCLDRLPSVLDAYSPEMVVVQGDTATVLFGALAGFFARTRVAHVEAGLRSGDRWRPYPEEVFRRLTTVLTELHFAPTPGARENLLAENVPAARIHLTGNPIVDAVRRMASVDREIADPVVADALASAERLALLTAHRRESFGPPIRSVFAAVRELVERHDDLTLLYPVHPNPNVLEPAKSLLGGHERIRLTGPVDYLDLLAALRRSDLVLTDSGGIQEEAPSFGTPVLVLREVTERPEAVRSGIARIVGTDPDRILASATELLDDADARRRVAQTANPFGDGRAGRRIADIIVHELTGRGRTTTDWTGGE